MSVLTKSGATFSNVEPRKMYERVKDPKVASQIRRGLAAMENGIEALTYFAPAVALAVATKANPDVVDTLSLTFIGTRMCVSLI